MGSIWKESGGWKIATLAVLIVLLSSFSLCIGEEEEKDENGTGEEEDIEVVDVETEDRVGTYRVTRVIDGDTFEIEGGKKVRLIGINTPEKDQPYYDQATDALSALLLDKDVRLEKDVSDTDMYERLLRYVFIGDTFVNLAMIKAGLATAYEYEPDTKYSKEFKEAEQEAKKAGVGMWAASEEQYDIMVIEFHYDADGPDEENLNDEYVVLHNNGTQPVRMTDWSVRDESNSEYRFPTFTLGANANVTLHTGSGEDTAEDLFWNKRSPVWNNRGDTLYLRDKAGLIAIEYEY